MQSTLKCSCHYGISIDARESNYDGQLAPTQSQTLSWHHGVSVYTLGSEWVDAMESVLAPWSQTMKSYYGINVETLRWDPEVSWIYCWHRELKLWVGTMESVLTPWSVTIKSVLTPWGPTLRWHHGVNALEFTYKNGQDSLFSVKQLSDSVQTWWAIVKGLRNTYFDKLGQFHLSKTLQSHFFNFWVRIFRKTWSHTLGFKGTVSPI
jgi:hypothetical protein